MLKPVVYLRAFDNAVEISSLPFSKLESSKYSVVIEQMTDTETGRGYESADHALTVLRNILAHAGIQALIEE
jgi:hypothetical protein